MDDVRARLFRLIDATPHLDWLLLTKRPENIRKMWPFRVSDYGQDQDQHVQELLGESVRTGDRTTALRYRRNVWLGTTVENQAEAEKRIPELLKCRDLSPVLWLSCEPLLGPLDLEYPEFINKAQMCCSGHECGCRGLPVEPPLTYYLDWVIAGGESGPNARPTKMEWYEALAKQCQDAGLAFHFKQLGQADYPKTFRDFETFPESLQVRELPEVK